VPGGTGAPGAARAAVDIKARARAMRIMTVLH
jgi:hypothetical protein